MYVYLVGVVGVDVFPPPHTNYLIRNLVVNTHNTSIILGVVLIVRPPPCSDLRTKSDLTIDMSDVAENIVSGAMLVVLQDSQHIGHL
jgi:hypothetical protein